MKLVSAENGEESMAEFNVVALLMGSFGLKVQAKDLRHAVRLAVMTPREIELEDSDLLQEYTDMIDEVYDIYVYDSESEEVGGNYLEDENTYHNHLAVKVFAKYSILIFVLSISYFAPVAGVIFGSLLTLLVFFPKLLERFSNGGDKEFDLIVSGYGALSLIIEAENAMEAAETMKSALGISRSDRPIPDEMELFMTMTEITSMKEVISEEVVDLELYGLSRKTYALLGFPASWFFIPIGVLAGVILSLFR
jgi:hypothetical protein